MDRRAVTALSLLSLCLLAAGPARTAAQPGRVQQAADAAAAAQDSPEQQAPVAQGAVSRLLIDPYGRVDGLWLEDGTIVRCSPRMGEQLAARVRPGDLVSVRGVAYAEHTVQALSVRNDSSGATVAQPPAPAPARAPFAPPPQAEPLEPLQVHGRIAAVLRGRRSEANGVILDDGSIVRFPPYTMPFVVRAGEPFAAAGKGTRNDYGLSMEAVSVGRSPAALQPLYAGMR